MREGETWCFRVYEASARVLVHQVCNGEDTQTPEPVRAIKKKETNTQTTHDQNGIIIIVSL